MNSVFRHLLSSIRIAPVIGLALIITQAKSSFSSEQESYLARTEISAVPARPHPELGQAWQRVKRGHFEVVAMLLEMYPDRELYFLARDAELLHDLATIEAQGDPELLKRLHLLNVSRANVGSSQLKDYLAQEGLSEERLRTGKKILFVDTGYHGSIAEKILSQFPEALRQNFKTHLMASWNSKHPSSMTFLTALNPGALRVSPKDMESPIREYEGLPRGTDSSDQFVRFDGKWHPMSPVLDREANLRKKETVRGYREDLVHEARDGELRKLMESRRTQWRRLRKIVSREEPSEVAGALRAFLVTHSGDPFVEAMVRDLFDMSDTGHLPGAVRLSMTLQDLGLPLSEKLGSRKGKYILLAHKYPQWAGLLESPDEEILKLIRAGRSDALLKLIREVSEGDLARVVFNLLGSEGAAPEARAVIRALIEGSPEVHPFLVRYTFTQPESVEQIEELRLLIEKGDPTTRKALVAITLKEPVWSDRKYNELRWAAGDTSGCAGFFRSLWLRMSGG